MKRASVMRPDTLASRLQTAAGAAEALARLSRRDPESMAAFILSLARYDGAVADQVRTFIVGDDVGDAVESLRERIARLEPPTEYAQRHAQGRQVAADLECILDSIERLLVPVDPLAAFNLLVKVIEADGVTMENCGDHDWEVSCAYERAIHLMGITAPALPRRVVADKIRTLMANDGYGIRAALDSVLTAEEHR